MRDFQGWGDAAGFGIFWLPIGESGTSGDAAGYGISRLGCVEFLGWPSSQAGAEGQKHTLILSCRPTHSAPNWCLQQGGTLVQSYCKRPLRRTPTKSNSSEALGLVLACLKGVEVCLARCGITARLLEALHEVVVVHVAVASWGSARRSSSLRSSGSRSLLAATRHGARSSTDGTVSSGRKQVRIRVARFV